MKRGSISHAIAQARKALKHAASDNHNTRFTKDRTFALRMIEAGYSQRTMNQWDWCRQSYPIQDEAMRSADLPDPTGMPMGDSLRPARFVFFDEDMKNYVGDRERRSSSTLGDRLYRAGLVENSADLPVAWFGSFFGLDEFAHLGLAARAIVADQILTFGADHQRLDLSSQDALLAQLQDYAQKDMRSMQDTARQAREMAESNRAKSQQKGKGKSKDKGEEKGKQRSEPYGKGGYGKGSYGYGYQWRRYCTTPTAS